MNILQKLTTQKLSDSERMFLVLELISKNIFNINICSIFRKQNKLINLSSWKNWKIKKL